MSLPFFMFQCIYQTSVERFSRWCYENKSTVAVFNFVSKLCCGCCLSFYMQGIFGRFF